MTKLIKEMMKIKKYLILLVILLGLLQETKEEWLNYKKGKIEISEKEIENKIDLRNKARADKNYKEADKIRD